MHHETVFNVTRYNRNLQGVHTPSESEHKSDTVVMVLTKQKRISPEKSCETNYCRQQTKLREDACHMCLSFCSEGGGRPHVTPRHQTQDLPPSYHTWDLPLCYWHLAVTGCSNLFSWGPTPQYGHLVLATETRTVGKRAVRILLECCRTYEGKSLLLFRIRFCSVWTSFNLPSFTDNKYLCSFCFQALKTYSNYQQ